VYSWGTSGVQPFLRRQAAGRGAPAEGMSPASRAVDRLGVDMGAPLLCGNGLGREPDTMVTAMSGLSSAWWPFRLGARAAGRPAVAGPGALVRTSRHLRPAAGGSSSTASASPSRVRASCCAGPGEWRRASRNRSRAARACCP
jgi:hypothetical protein